jgi:MSHA biogenesis protein MshO
MRRHRSHAGFTLVEAIVVIAVMGIVGAIVAVFIRLPVQNYADSVARAEVSDEADLALRRMAREIRLALPNSIRVSSDGSAIEFLLTKTGGRYLSADDAASATYPPLDFVGGATTLTVVGQLSQALVTTDYFVIYNLGNGMAPSDAWGFASTSPTNGRNIARINAAAAAGTSTITLFDNPFSAQSPPMPSPGNRFQIVSGPVMYACAPASDGALVLTRYSGHSINATMTIPPTNATSTAPLTRRVRNCAGLFTYDTTAGTTSSAQRTSLVSLALELAARTPAGTAPTSTIRLVHQVHVDNTP